MGQRHFPNSFNMFEMDQGHNQNYTAGQSHVHIGNAVAPDHGPVGHQMNNMLMGRVNCDSQWNSENRAHSYPGPSFSTEVQYIRPALPRPYYDSFPQSSAIRNSYPTPEDNPSHVYSSYYNRNTFHEIEGGLLDPVTGTGRGSYKRKNPGVSVAYDRGSTSRIYGAGSSSGSSELLLEKASSDHRNIPLGPHGLPHYRVGGLPFAGEDSSRSVRSRPRLESEPNSMTTHTSSYSSRHYHSTTHTGQHVEHSYMNANETTQGCSFVPLPSDTRGINGLNHTSHQFFPNGSANNVAAPSHDSILSGNHVFPPQCFHGPPVQAAREIHGNSSRGVSSYMAGPIHSSLGHEAAYSENGFIRSRVTHSSGISRPLYGEGWHNNYRSGRSSLAIGRFQSVSGMVDVHDRSGSEARSAVDHSSLYIGSRNLFDQYRDMRLDVDNMSYEELLALGERIGNVSTGLPEDKISNSLSEKTYYSSGQNHEEGSCSICLEEYVSKDEIGTLNSCGHSYHGGCIRKWLSMKNVCPICKSPASKDC